MITKLDKFTATSFFFIASFYLFGGLQKLDMAIHTDTWEPPLILLLTIVFGVGWWYEGVYEGLFLSRGRKIAILAMLGLLFVFALLLIWSLVIPLGFLQHSIIANSLFLMSGFFFRLSAMHPDIILKLKTKAW